MFSFHKNAHNQQIEYSDQARPDKPICFFDMLLVHKDIWFKKRNPHNPTYIEFQKMQFYS